MATKHELNRMFTLNNPFAPRICPELAQEIGLNESILLLQLDFWISVDSKYHDGNYWTYQSVTALQEAFPFWSRGNIQNIVKRLENKNLIHIGNYNKSKFDRTRWFAINVKSTSLLKSIIVRARNHPIETKKDTRDNVTTIKPITEKQGILTGMGINNPKNKQLVEVCSLQEIKEIAKFAEEHNEVSIGWWVWLLDNHEGCRLPEDKKRAKSNSSFDSEAFFQSVVDRNKAATDVL